MPELTTKSVPDSYQIVFAAILKHSSKIHTVDDRGFYIVNDRTTPLDVIPQGFNDTLINWGVLYLYDDGIVRFGVQSDDAKDSVAFWDTSEAAELFLSNWRENELHIR